MWLEVSTLGIRSVTAGEESERLLALYRSNLHIRSHIPAQATSSRMQFWRLGRTSLRSGTMDALNMHRLEGRTAGNGNTLDSPTVISRSQCPSEL